MCQSVVHCFNWTVKAPQLMNSARLREERGEDKKKRKRGSEGGKGEDTVAGSCY